MSHPVWPGHYWKRILCRELEALPRAKSRALGKDTLCRGLVLEALGKVWPSTKRPLPWARPSAKIIFAEGYGPRQRHPEQIWPVGSRGWGSSGFAEGQPLGPRQSFFIWCLDPKKYFFINSLCRGTEMRPSAKTPFAEGPRQGHARPSAKIFFYFFVFEPNFFVVLQYILLNPNLKFGLILTFLNIFASFNLFLWFFQIFQI